MKNARDCLEYFRLDRINEYLTVERFAEHNGLRVEHAKQLLALAEAVHNAPHPEA